MSPPTLIVGIGSPHGDDQAGWQVAERLASQLDQAEADVRAVASPIQLLDWLDDVRRLIVCDACQGLGRVGEVRRWHWPAAELQEASWSGTHDFALPAVLQLAKRLQRLPLNVAIWSVEGRAKEALGALSSEVATALPQIVQGITNELNQGHSCTKNRS